MTGCLARHLYYQLPVPADIVLTLCSVFILSLLIFPFFDWDALNFAGPFKRLINAFPHNRSFSYCLLLALLLARWMRFSCSCSFFACSLISLLSFLYPFLFTSRSFISLIYVSLLEEGGIIKTPSSRSSFGPYNSSLRNSILSVRWSIIIFNALYRLRFGNVGSITLL